jgi:hypothetical protein
MGLQQDILCILKMFYENMYRMQSKTNWTIKEKFGPDLVQSFRIGIQLTKKFLIRPDPDLHHCSALFETKFSILSSEYKY